jgi:hypothetical protein
MSPEVIQRIVSGVSALAICACLAAGSLAFSSNAEARVSGPRDTSLEQRCGFLQDEFDKWWDRYVAAPAGSPGETKAYQMMGNMENAWADIGCDDAFGSIGFKPIPLKQHLAPSVALR